MLIEKGSNQTGKVKELSFTAEQAVYVGKRLPPCFVLLPIGKAAKEQTAIAPRIKSTKRIDVEEELGELSKSHKDLDKTQSSVRKQQSKMSTPQAK